MKSMPIKSKVSCLTNDNDSVDCSDTLSIVSVQSSIFDIDPLSCYTLENFYERNRLVKGNSQTLKGKKKRLENKLPENWLYDPKLKVNSTIHEDPLDWTRNVFMDKLNLSKNDLTKKLYKSHGDLSEIHDTPLITYPKTVETRQSTSDLKFIAANNEFVQANSINICRTAPGSSENITEPGRASYKDFMAMAREQEKSLKAEVMKRRKESLQKTVPDSTNKSMKYIKNRRSSANSNRFGFAQNLPKPSYSKPSPDNTSSRSKPRTHTPNRTSQIPLTKSMDFHRTLNYYHV